MSQNTEEKEFNFKPYVGIAIFMFIIVIIAYISNFHEQSLSKDSGDWGTFGDYMGGILNPILAFLSFLALLQTIKIQSRELKASREELELTREELARSADAQKEQSNSIKIQNFENTFFNMINLHNEIIRNINFNSELKFEYDRLNIYANYKKLLLSLPYSNALDNKNGKQAIQAICETIDIFYNDHYNKIFSKVYDLCHENLQIYVGHYFGNIYQILKFISINKDFNDEEKRKYSDLFRAQFSSVELKLLFYHCTGEIGSKKFKNYIEEFKFFEHLVIESNNKIFQAIFSSNIYDIKAFDKNKEIIEFMNIKKEENRKWLEEYNLKGEKEQKDFYLEAVKRFNYINENTLAMDIFKKYSNNYDGNFYESNIEYLNKQIENVNTSSQEQQ